MKGSNMDAVGRNNSDAVNAVKKIRAPGDGSYNRAMMIRTT